MHGFVPGRMAYEVERGASERRLVFARVGERHGALGGYAGVGLARLKCSRTGDDLYNKSKTAAQY